MNRDLFESETKWKVTMSSDLYGTEEFQYDSLFDALAGRARLETSASRLNDGIERTFSIDIVS